MKAYRLREVPLRTDIIEPRGSLLDGWSFWFARGQIGYGDCLYFGPGPYADVRILVYPKDAGERSLWIVRSTRSIPTGQLSTSRSAALPKDFLAADNAAAAEILGVPELLIPCLYARYDAADIVPKPEQ